VQAFDHVGGDGSLGLRNQLQESGINCIGVPKTIDTISKRARSRSFRFSVNVVVDALDRLPHYGDEPWRVIVVEVMGRHAGWIALQAVSPVR